MSTISTNESMGGGGADVQTPGRDAPATQTTAGNYFVSNYPPFSFWKPEFKQEAFDAMQRPPKDGTDLGLYLHIPFCRKRCHFCYFRVYTDKDSASIKRYLDCALEELTIYASKPFIGGRKPKFVYFGGGTPSYLSENQMRYLFDGMKERLPWNDVEEVTFECEPGTLTDHKLKTLRELGVTRLSLGVENFSDRILEVNGRAHRSKEIWRAYSTARSLGFPQINIDLIAGMVEETESNWKECIEHTLQLAPDSLTIYQMEVPYNTTIYREMKTAGQLVAPVAGWETKRRWVNEAFKAMEQRGYQVGSAYTVVKDKQKTRFIYRDRLWLGSDLLSMGVASFGHINGTHYQNHHDFDPYVTALGQGVLPIYRALTPNADERLIRELVLLFKLGRIDADHFRSKYGVDVMTRFAAPIAAIVEGGFGTVDSDSLKLNREGLLQVDRLAHGFFLEQHRNARYA